MFRLLFFFSERIFESGGVRQESERTSVQEWGCSTVGGSSREVIVILAVPLPFHWESEPSESTAMDASVPTEVEVEPKVERKKIQFAVPASAPPNLDPRQVEMVSSGGQNGGKKMILSS